MSEKTGDNTGEIGQLEQVENVPNAKRSRKSERGSSKRSLFGRGVRGWFWRRMPKGLYARSVLIVIIPMVLLQSVVAFVFMERHWQTVTERLSKAVVGDIAAIIDVIEKYPQDPEYDKIVDLAGNSMGLNISVLPPDAFPPASSKPFFDILDDVLRSEITQQINRPFWIDTLGASNLLEIRIRLTEPDKVLRVFVRRNRAYASNSHIFLMWMVGTSLVLVAISIMLLRNQIKPILHLADAAERFGKGQKMPKNFRVRGATEVRQAGLAFMQMRERIARQIEQRTAMLTGVSHDLRTILTRFKLQLALVGESEEIDAMQQDVDEMQKMLQGYIDFARGESGEERIEIKLHEVLAKYVKQAEISGKGYKFNCREDICFSGRSGAIGRLFGNLVSNAFRYADDVEVSASKSAGWVTVVIDDNGPGIPKSLREEVFRPFMRLDEARNLDESGTGLGLSIARDIARNHGGDINLHDSPMGGLRAIVKLPV